MTRPQRKHVADPLQFARPPLTPSIDPRGSIPLKGGDDVVKAVIGAAFLFLIILFYEFGVWQVLRVLSVRLLLPVASLSVRLLRQLIFLTFGILALIGLILKIVEWVRDKSKVARPSNLSNDMPAGNNAPSTTGGGGEVGSDRNQGGPQKFTYKVLKKATNSFDQKLGQGGSGTVYKGHIGKDQEPVAVKKITSSAHQGISAYIAEVITMIQLNHRNLVKLKGYCHESNEFTLVYEFIGGGSLCDHLFKFKEFLTWERRYNIALGLASALEYLHKKRPQCVIHRDIKSSNVMLDEAFVAKLGDFGLAKLVDHNGVPNPTQLAGTIGYLAPEYFQMGIANKESDIYSFGVVLLEIVCGRRAVFTLNGDQQNLVEWAWKRYGLGKLLNAVDSRLRGNFNKEQAKALVKAGLWCAHPIATYRPSIEKAMTYLKLEEEPPELPSEKPPYCY